MTPVPKAVTFDFWNTIACEPPGTMATARRRAVAAACESGGVEVEAERLAAGLDEVVSNYQRSWAQGTHFHPEQGAEMLVGALGIEGAAGELVAEAFLTAGRGAELDLAQASPPACRPCASAGSDSGSSATSASPAASCCATSSTAAACSGTSPAGPSPTRSATTSPPGRSSKSPSAPSERSRGRPSTSATCAAPTSPGRARSGWARSAIAGYTTTPAPTASRRPISSSTVTCGCPRPWPALDRIFDPFFGSRSND